MALNMRTGRLADIASLDHVNILTADVEACRRFYVDALGFEEALVLCHQPGQAEHGAAGFAEYFLHHSILL